MEVEKLESLTAEDARELAKVDDTKVFNEALAKVFVAAKEGERFVVLDKTIVWNVEEMLIKRGFYVGYENGIQVTRISW